jgi:hypothetical protein
MVARLQGFPDSWEIAGRKTAAYRQVGNAFPPPVARALGTAIADALSPVIPTPAATGSTITPAWLSNSICAIEASSFEPIRPRQTDTRRA